MKTSPSHDMTFEAQDAAFLVLAATIGVTLLNELYAHRTTEKASEQALLLVKAVPNTARAVALSDRLIPRNLPDRSAQFLESVVIPAASYFQDHKIFP